MIAIKIRLSSDANTYRVYIDRELFGYTTDDELGFALEVAVHKVNAKREEQHNDKT
jgi:hypothetical protein